MTNDNVRDEARWLLRSVNKSLKIKQLAARFNQSGDFIYRRP
jgi:hypothetical protein